MIDAGIDINYQQERGNTALHKSAEHNTTKVADLLIKANAKLNLKNRYKETPFDAAKRMGTEDIFKKVQRKNGNIVAQDSFN